MRLLVGWLGLVGACLSVACGGETPDVDTPARGGRGGMSAGTGGNAGTATMNRGGPGAGDPDAGPAGSGGTGGSGQAGGGGCPVVAPTPIPGRSFAIAAINVTRKILVLENVSNQPVALDTEWQWCSIPKYGRLTEDSETVAPGAFKFLDISDSFDKTVEGGDMGIYIKPDYQNAESIDAYVIWGEGFDSPHRENVAAAAGIWTFGERATINPGDAGLIAVGRTDDPSGYASAPANCF